VIVPLEEDAVSSFVQWWKANKIACDEASGYVQGFLGKGPGTVLRLSLILEMAWWAHGGIIGPPQAVTGAAVAAACRLYEEYLVPMAQRVYAGPRRSPLEVQASELLRHIRRKRMTSVNASEIRRQRLANLRRREEVDNVITRLCQAGWLKAKPSRAGDTKGRMRSDYEVNPRLWA
jgi:hypothetical protein